MGFSLSLHFFFCLTFDPFQICTVYSSSQSQWFGVKPQSWQPAVCCTLLRSGETITIVCMLHNPTATVNLFHVGKQYLTLCKAEAAVTHNLIGRKIISSIKRSDARNLLPILDVIHSSHKRHSASEHCKWTLRQTTGVCYTCSERHLTFRRNIDTRRQWSVGNIGWNEWLSWEMVINDHCHGSVRLLLLYSITNCSSTALPVRPGPPTMGFKN